MTIGINNLEGNWQKLSEKIEEHRGKLTFPILVLSQEEAANILLGRKQIEERYVYPLLWEENIDKESLNYGKGN